MAFVIPPRSQVGVLDPEIAGEGVKVMYDSDGDPVIWSPPPPKPVMPDWSGIKSIRKYFGRKDHQAWPAWFYHPTEEPRMIRNAEEGAQLGVCYRDATNDEKGRYGLKKVWDWKDDCLWRPQPYKNVAFDPQKPQQGKNYIPSAPNPVVAQNALLEALIPAVAAAVAKSLNANGPEKPADIDPVQWQEFLEFKAWQKTSQIVDTVAKTEEVKEDEPDDPPDDQSTNALNALRPEQERELWKAEAERKGIRVDGRWSLDRLKAEVEKAA